MDHEGRESLKQLLHFERFLPFISPHALHSHGPSAGGPSALSAAAACFGAGSGDAVSEVAAFCASRYDVYSSMAVIIRSALPFTFPLCFTTVNERGCLDSPTS